MPSKRSTFLKYMPYAADVLKVVENDVFLHTTALQLYGPRGCLKRDVAEACCDILGTPPVEITWFDLRVRTDKVLNRLMCTPAHGRKRTVIISLGGGLSALERMQGLFEFREANNFIILAESRLPLDALPMRVFPLSREATGNFLKWVSKKCQWRFSPDIVDPVFRFTGGLPAHLINLIQITKNVTKPSEVLAMVEAKKNRKVADELYDILISKDNPYGVVAESIGNALNQTGWMDLTEIMQSRLREDFLGGNAVPESAMAGGAWSILERFNPRDINEFVAACFRIHELATNI